MQSRSDFQNQSSIALHNGTYVTFQYLFINIATCSEQVGFSSKKGTKELFDQEDDFNSLVPMQFA